MKKVFLFLSCILFVWNCSKEDKIANIINLEDLPLDEGGTHVPILLGSTTAPYGFYIYRPSGYKDNGPKFPLLIFLHGAGERGNSHIDTSALEDILVHGPPSLIENNKWNPTYPMLVVSPQCHETSWSATRVHHMITFIKDNYQINSKRIYITGLSMGGFGIYNYIETMINNSYSAAVVPICGGGDKNKGDRYLNIPLWAFHGFDDNTVPLTRSVDMVQAINNAGASPKALLTIYPNVGHNSWTRTYDGTGMSQEMIDSDPFNMSIYDWMFQYVRK